MPVYSNDDGTTKSIWTIAASAAASFLLAAGTLTADRTLTCPDASGIISIRDDFGTNYNKLGPTNHPTFDSVTVSTLLDAPVIQPLAAGGGLTIRQLSGSGGVTVFDGATNSGSGLQITRDTISGDGARIFWLTNNVAKWKTGLAGSDSFVIASSTSGNTSLSINVTTDVVSLSTPLLPSSGGTGQSSYTNGQLLIGNTTGNTLTKATLTGTTNQIVVTNGGGSITLSTPQDIGTASNVQFGSVGVGVAAGGFSVSVMPKSDSNGLFVVRRASGANSGSYWGFFVQNPGATDSFILGQSNSLNGGPLGWIAANDAFCYYPSGRFVWGNSHPTITMSSGNNLQLGGDTTSATLVGATADIVSMAGVDRVNTRHAAAGNRLEGIQAERGSAVYIGDDAIDFAATTAYITVNATDIALTSTTIALPQKITTYNNIATVSNGIPSELATVDLTGQTAAKTATTIYTPAATGMYRISVYLQVTTASSTSSILGGATGVVLTYNDGDGNVAQSDTVGLMSTVGTIVTTSSTNTTATNLNGSTIIYARTGVAIQYAIGYTSVGVTPMQYAAHLKVEAL